MISRIKGTQDFLDLTLFDYILSTTKTHLARYNFTQIATPILEPTELFKRTLGQQTDVVTKQMFTIATGPEDDGICLRPEATASIVRAFVENGMQHVPWKVYTWGPMFRYERPQKGRFRQFHQVSMEIIGSNAVAQDAHFIKMLDRYFDEVLTISDYALLINFVGCLDDRLAFKTLLDEFLNSGHGEHICATCKERREKNILRIFDCKNETCQEIYKKAPAIASNLCTACTAEWQQLQRDLELLSVTFAHAPTLVRGLDYYSKTVFEFVSHNLGAQSAFCAGGRYDQLVGHIGGKEDQPAIGAAMGIERLILLLDPIQDTLPLPTPPTLHVIMPVAPEQHILGLLIADELQAVGLAVELLLEGSVKGMMRKANKLGAQYVLMIGSDEQENKTILLKNMATGAEEQVLQAEVVKKLKG